MGCSLGFSWRFPKRSRLLDWHDCNALEMEKQGYLDTGMSVPETSCAAID
jgi:hypothetical protein